MALDRFSQITRADMAALATAANAVTGLAGDYEFGIVHRWRGLYDAAVSYTAENSDGNRDAVFIESGPDAGMYACILDCLGVAPTAGGNANWLYLGGVDSGPQTFDGVNQYGKKWLEVLNDIRQDCWTTITTPTESYTPTDLTKLVVSGPWPVPKTILVSDRLALTQGNLAYGGGFGGEAQQIFTQLRMVTTKAGATLRVKADNICSLEALNLTGTTSSGRTRHTWVIRRKSGETVGVYFSIRLHGENSAAFLANITSSNAIGSWTVADDGGDSVGYCEFTGAADLTFWVEVPEASEVNYSGYAWCEYSTSTVAPAISSAPALEIVQANDDVFKVTANGSTANLCDLFAYPFGLAGESRWSFYAKMLPVFKLNYNHNRAIIAPGQWDPGNIRGWAVPQAPMVSLITQGGGATETAIQTTDDAKPRQPTLSIAEDWMHIDCLWAVRAGRKADQHQPLLSKASAFRTYPEETVQTGCFRGTTPTYFDEGEIVIPTNKFWQRVELTKQWPVFDNKPLLYSNETAAYVTGACIQLIDVLNTAGGGATPLRIELEGAGDVYPRWVPVAFYNDTLALVEA